MKRVRSNQRSNDVNRKSLYLAASLLALCPAAGRAEITVIDPTSISQLKEAYQTATQTLSEAKGIYQQTTNIWSAISHGTFINSIAPELENGNLTNPLGNVGNLGSQLLGQGGTVPGAQAILDKAQVYNIPGADQVAQLLNQRAQSQADVQALGMQSAQVAQQRISGLDEIQQQLNGANNIEDIQAIQARLQAETAIAQAQQGQMQQISMLQQSQMNQAQLQDQQLSRKAADEWASATAGALK